MNDSNSGFLKNGWLDIHTSKLTWIPKMMVWKRGFLLNMAIFGIYVKFLGIATSHDRFSPKGEIFIYLARYIS